MLLIIAIKRWCQERGIESVDHNHLGDEYKNLIDNIFNSRLNVHLIKGQLVKTESIFDIRKPLKNDEKCILYQYRFSFPSQDISIFITIFESCRKTA